MRLAYVDLETSGGMAVRDRIIEIAIVVEQDGYEVERWQQLVNPDLRLSGFIIRYTGIDDRMLADAPRFEAIADRVAQLLQGATLVAHNARFDYGFLKNEFKRLGRRWQMPNLCTVKLSRLLFPQHRKHNLDALIERYQLPQVTRHRAMGDVEALVAFMRHLRQTLPTASLDSALQQVMQRPSLPVHLDADCLDDIPQSPGVYRFYGAQQELLYVGKSVNLYSRVMSHFQGDHSSAKGQNLAAQIHRLEWQQCAGELGSLLLELEQIREQRPLFNRRAKPAPQLFSFSAQPDARGYLQIALQHDIEPALLDRRFGLFRSERQAHKALRGLVDKHRLCARLSGLEPGQGSCFAHQVKQCNGACCGDEPAQLYNLRVQVALSHMRLHLWPWPTAIVVEEHDKFTDIRHYYLIDQWRYLGTYASFADACAARPVEPLGFALEEYKLLSCYLLGNKGAFQVQLAQ